MTLVRQINNAGYFALDLVAFSYVGMCVVYLIAKALGKL